jgi:hypothetical protein
LIGPYPADKELYQQRSPIHSADKISAPVALFQVRGQRRATAAVNRQWAMQQQQTQG